MPGNVMSASKVFYPEYILPTQRLFFFFWSTLAVVILCIILKMFPILILSPIIILIFLMLYLRIESIHFDSEIRVIYLLGKKQTYQYEAIRKLEAEYIVFEKGFVSFNNFYSEGEIDHLSQQSTNQFREILDCLMQSGKIQSNQLWTEDDELKNQEKGIYTFLIGSGIAVAIWLGLLLSNIIPPNEAVLFSLFGLLLASNFIVWFLRRQI